MSKPKKEPVLTDPQKRALMYYYRAQMIPLEVRGRERVGSLGSPDPRTTWWLIQNGWLVQNLKQRSYREPNYLLTDKGMPVAKELYEQRKALYAHPKERSC